MLPETKRTEQPRPLNPKQERLASKQDSPWPPDRLTVLMVVFIVLLGIASATHFAGLWDW